jgi:hypothetical protein
VEPQRNGYDFLWAQLGKGYMHKSVIDVFASLGQTIDDVLAIISIIGSAILLLGAFVSDKPIGRFGEIANWSILGLVFGIICQVSIAITHPSFDRVGIFIRMPYGTVNFILTLSFVMLVGRGFVLKNKYRLR